MCLVSFGWGDVDAKQKFVESKNGELKWAVLELLMACNLNCKWCYANSPTAASRILSKEDALYLVNFLADAGIRQITLSGGEPTIYPHIEAVIKEGAGRGLIMHMNTNGYLLDEGKARQMKEWGLSQTQINIDSLDPKKHDFIRGKKDSFVNAVRGIKSTIDAGMISACQTVVTKENESEILDIFKFARSLGVQRCRVWDMTPSEGVALKNSYLLPSDYVLLLRKLNEYVEQTGGSNITSCEPLFPRVADTNLDIYGGFCMARTGKIGMHILPEGDVIYCATNRDKLYNIFELEQPADLNLVHSKKISEYNQGVIYHSDCRSCSMFNDCQGGCLTRQKRSLNNKDYFCST